MKKRIVKILKIIGIIAGAIVLILAGLILFLTVTEYKPAYSQPADELVINEDGRAAGQSLTVCSWNIGYAGLGCESDFFMDGGKMVNPPDRETVEKNLQGIQSYMLEHRADVWLMQEVDIDSARTGGMNQFEAIGSSLQSSSAFAYNYKCPFVPIPLPPMGRIESGIATFTGLQIKEDAERISLPCPYKWPTRAANIKRCLLVTRTEIEGTDRELVLINLHLEAYESGAGRIAQTKQLLELMQAEYEAGNYVIAGGDFNQTFPDTRDIYPIRDPEQWTPGALEESVLQEGWQLAYDASSATCRLLDQPYCEDCQLYVIDGFILSPNVQLNSVRTDGLNFEFSDHNPVWISVTLLP